MTDSGYELTTDYVQQTTRDLRVILISLMAPGLMMIINHSMVSVALPSLRSSFGASTDLVAWVATAYTLPYAIVMPVYGRLGDTLGKRQMLLAGNAVFLVGTGINLMSTDLRLLLVGRAIQGAGAAGVVPLAIAMISELFPTSERGRALGTWNSIGPATFTVGPLLAGFIIETLSWRVIFVPVLIIGVLTFLLVRARVPAIRTGVRSRILRHFDWGGVVLLITAMTVLLLYVSSDAVTGVTALRDWRLLTLALALSTGFVVWEKRQVDPFISLDILARGTFGQASFCAGVRMFSLGGMGFLLPLYLTDVHRLSAISVGAILLAQSTSLLTTMRLGGQIADRWGSRLPVVLGLLMQVGAMVYFALLPGTAPLWLVVLGLVNLGLSAGLSLAALHRSAISQIPREQLGVAAGLYSMIRFSGTALSTALAGVILQQAFDRSYMPLYAYRIVFWFLAGVLMLGVVTGLTLQD